jgi:hypothetical protein
MSDELCMCFSPDCERCWGELTATPDTADSETPEYDLGGES